MYYFVLEQQILSIINKILPQNLKHKYKYLYLTTMYITFSMTMPHANMHIILMNVTHMLIAPLIAKSIDLEDE